jgi:DNA-directed RNA polymerase specialized sigma24 family protein
MKPPPITITIQIIVDTARLDEQLDRVRDLVAHLGAPPAAAPAPASVDLVRTVLAEAPDDADGPELARRIKAAAKPPAPVADRVEPAAHGGARPGSGRKAAFTITHEELDAQSDKVERWLTPIEQTAIRLKADGKSYRLIAELTGTSEKAVYATIRRCREKLSRPAGYTPTRRGRRRRVSAPIVNEGSVHCRYCQANRTQLHCDQHELDVKREQARQESERAKTAHLPRPTGVGGAA